MTRKTQKKLRKLLTLVCCAVMLVCVTVGATIAYLTDDDTVTNTFTVGNVQIRLDEAPVGTNGKKIDGARVKTNSYKLYPGGSYDKDPMVTVEADSEESYIRMLVTVSNYENLKDAFDVAAGEELLLQNYVTGWDNSKWVSTNTIKVDATANTAVYEFRYYTTVETVDKAEKALEPLFKTVEIPGSIDNENLQLINNTQITVVAQAIQKDGFATADAAWAAFEG